MEANWGASMEAKVVGGAPAPPAPPLDRLHPDGRGVGFSKENHGGRAAGVCRVRACSAGGADGGWFARLRPPGPAGIDW